MKQTIALLIMLSLLSCEKENHKTEPLNVKNINFSDCANDSSAARCLSIQAIGDSYLFIQHQKTMFCCGTDEIDINVELRNDTIYIQEIDLGPFTYCYCWHDITFELGPLNKKHYTLQIIGCETSYNRDSILIKFQYSDDLYFSICIG